MKRKYLLILISFFAFKSFTSCSKNNQVNENGDKTKVMIGSISEETMPDYVHSLGKQATLVKYSDENNLVPKEQQIGYTISYGDGEVENKKKVKKAEVTRPLKQYWKYRLLAFDPQTGIKAGDITYTRGQENANMTMELTVGKSYTFVCYSTYNTTSTTNNGAPASLPIISTDNINTAEITGIDGGASFMIWKETRAVHHGLKLNINLRHQFHGYQVTIKAPANYTFSITNGNDVQQGARIYPSIAFVNYRLSDMSISRAETNTNQTSLNPATVNTDFTSLMGASNYLDPYTKLGRAIRFVDPNDPNKLWAANNSFIRQLSCAETSFLTIAESNKSIYNIYQSVIRIHDIRLKRDSDSKTTSNQILFIPYINMQRHKMNRITINLIPPADF